MDNIVFKNANWGILVAIFSSLKNIPIRLEKSLGHLAITLGHLNEHYKETIGANI